MAETQSLKALIKPEKQYDKLATWFISHKFYKFLSAYLHIIL